MSGASGFALQAAMAAQSQMFIAGAMVGNVLDGGPESSDLYGLLVAGETAALATVGEGGSALFTSHRLLVAERKGMLSKRLAVKAIRRDGIATYAIDPDSIVSLTLSGGSFGTATLMFDPGFDPMHLTQWLGETLVSP